MDHKFKKNEKIYGEILNDFIDYSRNKLKVEVTKEEAKALLASYSYTPSNGNEKAKALLANGNEKEFCFYYFIKERLVDSDKRDFLENLAVANIMLSRIVRSREDLVNCRFYLDTPESLKLMGYWGKESLELHKEIIDCIKEKKGKLCIFKHNMEELEKILEGLSRNFRLGIYSAPNINHYIQALNDWANGEFEQPKLEVDWFIDKLKESEIEIIPKPDLTESSSNNVRLDEMELEKELSEAFYCGEEQDSKQLKRILTDIDSLQSVAFLRSKEDINNPVSYSDAGHIFITGNRAIVNVVKNKYFPDSSSIMFAENIVTLAGNLVKKGKNKLISKYLRLSLLDNLHIKDEFKEKLYRTKRQLEGISGNEEYNKIWLTNPNIEKEVYKRLLSGEESIEGILKEILENNNKEKKMDSLRAAVRKSEAENFNQQEKINSIKEDKNKIQKLLDEEKKKNKEKLESFIKKSWGYKYFWSFLYSFTLNKEEKLKNYVEKKLSKIDFLCQAGKAEH